MAEDETSELVVDITEDWEEECLANVVGEEDLFTLKHGSDGSVYHLKMIIVRSDKVCE